VPYEASEGIYSGHGQMKKMGDKSDFNIEIEK